MKFYQFLLFIKTFWLVVLSWRLEFVVFVYELIIYLVKELYFLLFGYIIIIIIITSTSDLRTATTAILNQLLGRLVLHKLEIIGML